MLSVAAGHVSSVSPGPGDADGDGDGAVVGGRFADLASPEAS